MCLHPLASVAVNAYLRKRHSHHPLREKQYSHVAVVFFHLLAKNEFKLFLIHKSCCRTFLALTKLLDLEGLVHPKFSKEQHDTTYSKRTHYIQCMSALYLVLSLILLTVQMDLECSLGFGLFHGVHDRCKLQKITFCEGKRLQFL